MVRQIGSVGSEGIKSYLDYRQEKLSPIENAILNVVTIVNEAENMADKSITKKLQLLVSDIPSGTVTSKEDAINIAKQALSRLPAPSYTIAQSAISLASKLKDEFDLDIE